VVVDDCSQDGSIGIVEKYPCKIIRLAQHVGASAARNAGAFGSTGEVLFFIDNDCIVTDTTIPRVRKIISEQLPDVVVGGTYTTVPYDAGFFSSFQSVFINYFETTNRSYPDYLASHALVICAGSFKKSGGFKEDFLHSGLHGTRGHVHGDRCCVPRSLPACWFSAPGSEQGLFRSDFFLALACGRCLVRCGIYGERLLPGHGSGRIGFG
jgi:glycosyltransferase involved in cell wall biosynthesis